MTCGEDKSLITPKCFEVPQVLLLQQIVKHLIPIKTLNITCLDQACVQHF